MEKAKMDLWKDKIIQELQDSHLRPVRADGVFATEDSSYFDVLVPFAGNLILFRFGHLTMPVVTGNDFLVNNPSFLNFKVSDAGDVRHTLEKLSNNGTFKSRKLEQQNSEIEYRERKGYFLREVVCLTNLLMDIEVFLAEYEIPYGEVKLIGVGKSSYRVIVPMFGGDIMGQEFFVEGSERFSSTNLLYMKQGNYSSLCTKVKAYFRDTIDEIIISLGGIEYVRENYQ